MNNENTFELRNVEKDKLWEALEHVIYNPHSILNIRLSSKK